MSATKNYNFYLARSLTAIENNASQMTFHFRARKTEDMASPPFFIFDRSKTHPIQIDQSLSDDAANSIISVWLEETDSPPEIPLNALFGEDHIFSCPNPPDFDKLKYDIKVFLNSDTTPDYTKDDIVYDQMDAEYPIH